MQALSLNAIPTGKLLIELLIQPVGCDIHNHRISHLFFDDIDRFFAFRYNFVWRYTLIQLIEYFSVIDSGCLNFFHVQCIEWRFIPIRIVKLNMSKYTIEIFTLAFWWSGKNTKY